ncbi:unnamed protein product [Commensalibacter communis]|uniref:hypothetical protein n=1 Tax=Commensalibacter communis TaxID=2972786 RepID=UPI0022FF74D8|nr:hypothetical protein [Commensalibacter communis]CAI3953132.1 unnamed protein product [Commensalibacter communis]
MKKTLFVLTALALPMVAQAETLPSTVPEATVKAAIHDFVDPWCQTGFKGMVENVQKCFKETSENSPNIDKCVIGHYMLSFTTKDLKNYSQKNEQEDPTKNIPFVGPQATHDRGVHYTNIARYKNIDVSNYFIPAVDSTYEKLIENRKKCSKD